MRMRIVCPTTTLTHCLPCAYWRVHFTVFQANISPPITPLLPTPELESLELESCTEVDELDAPVAPTDGRTRTFHPHFFIEIPPYYN